MFLTNNYHETFIGQVIEIIANTEIACNDAFLYDIHGAWK